MKALGLFLLFFLAAAPSRAASPYPAVEFRDLSDQKISAEGENALRLNPKAWKHAESAHFIYHYTDEKEAETVLVHAETYFAWVMEMFGVKEAPRGRKSHVFVFSNDKVWDDFRHRGTLERISGAEAFTDGNELFIHRMQFWLEPQRVLAHELTHVVLFRFVGGKVPLYLNEGYADFIGFKAIALKFGGDEYAMRTVSKVPAKYYMPLEKLAALKLYPKGLEETDNFYLQSQLLVRFLIERRGTVKFCELLKNASDFKSLNYGLRRVYGEDLAVVEEEFKKYAVST